MIERRSLIELYRRERRALAIPDYGREDLGTVVRYTPAAPDAAGIVCFTRVPEGDLGEEIERHIAHFRAAGIGFEWKVYDSDEPASLRARLLDAGFEEGEPETLMIYDLRKLEPAARAAGGGIEVKRVDAAASLHEIVELQQQVWSRSFAWLLNALRESWDSTSFYGAYERSRLVGAGWIEYPTNSRFAELHGGAVLPELRGRGIYSSLLQIRMIDALDRGLRWVAVDAAPMSRPILERKGFQRLDGTYPMTWPHNDT
jgi:N-acetylglutamate synthase-like GNAT family acetyltransferase